MAYFGPRVKSTNKFGLWLDRQLFVHNMTASEVAEGLHCSDTMISYHRTGKKHPTFCDVLAYCWFFKCDDDPEKVWKLAKISVEN